MGGGSGPSVPLSGSAHVGHRFLLFLLLHDRDDFGCLLITFANSSDPDQDY